MLNIKSVRVLNSSYSVFNELCMLSPAFPTAYAVVHTLKISLECMYSCLNFIGSLCRIRFRSAFIFHRLTAALASLRPFAHAGSVSGGLKWTRVSLPYRVLILSYKLSLVFSPLLSHAPFGWWAQVDSNHRPRAYQARALTC